MSANQTQAINAAQAICTVVLTPKSIFYSSVFLLLCQSNVVYTIVNWQLFSVLPKWKKGQACFYGALNI